MSEILTKAEILSILAGAVISAEAGVKRGGPSKWAYVEQMKYLKSIQYHLDGEIKQESNTQAQQKRDVLTEAFASKQEEIKRLTVYILNEVERIQKNDLKWPDSLIEQVWMGLLPTKNLIEAAIKEERGISAIEDVVKNGLESAAMAFHFLLQLPVWK